MHFKISRDKFYNLLNIASKAISANTPLPVFSGIKIDVKEDYIECTGSDSEISIKSRLIIDDSFTYELIEGGSIVINKNYIVEMIKKINNDIVELEILDGNLVKISDNNVEYKINGLKSSEYPLIDFNCPETKFNIKAKELKDIFSQTYFSASIQEIRPELTGINFKNIDGILQCVATDSFRLSKKKIKIDCNENFNVIIPTKSLNEVSKILENDDVVEIAINNKKAQFNYENTIIQTRLIEGNYPDVSRLVPEIFDYELVINGKELMNAIDRQSFIKNENEQFSTMKLDMSKDEVIISSRSLEIGSSKEILKFESFEGEPLSISFSGKYVYEALRGIGTDKIKIEFGSESKPFVIKDIESDNIIQLVLPIRPYY